MGLLGRLLGTSRRNPAGGQASEASGRGDGTLALAAVHAAGGIARATRDGADLATQIDALAFTLHVADRYAFEIGGDDVRTELMPGVSATALSILLAMLAAGDEVSGDLFQLAWTRLEEVHMDLGQCVALFPEEGIPRPTVLEVAHERLLRHRPTEEEGVHQAELLVEMMAAIRQAELREITALVVRNVAAEF